MKGWQFFVVWAAATAVTGLYSSNTGNWLALGCWVAATTLIYVASLFINPMQDCWRCKGSGWFSGWLFRYARGHCGRCLDSGRQRRLGAILLKIPPQ